MQLSELDYHCDSSLSKPIGMHPVCHDGYYKDAGDPLLAEIFDRTYIEADGSKYYLVIHHTGNGKWWCVVPADITDNKGMRAIDRVLKLAEPVSSTINDSIRKPFWHSLFPKFWSVSLEYVTEAINHDGNKYSLNSICMKNDIESLASRMRAGKYHVNQHNINSTEDK